MRIIKVLLFTGILILLAPLMGIAQSKNVEYTIIKLNTPTVTINGKILKVGDTFWSLDHIEWVDRKPAQAMEIEETHPENPRRPKRYTISKNVLANKSSRTVAEYDYIVTSKMSTRGVMGANIIRTKESFSEKRFAMVIGNSNYLYELHLANAVVDAEGISGKLVELGFDTQLVFDCDKEGMDRLIESLPRKLTQYEVVLFFYAGHGVSINHVPQIVPVDYDGDRNLCDTRKLLNSLSSDKLSIILLDMCRSDVSSASGIALQLEPPSNSNMAIAYSTSDGRSAFDGNLGMSPFAQGFIQALDGSNYALFDCLSEVSSYVKNTTDGHQSPKISSSVRRRFSFRPGSTVSGNVFYDFSPTKDGNQDVDGLLREAEEYRNGINGKEKDEEKAFQLYTLAYEKGSKEAAIFVSNCYLYGIGVGKDEKKGMEILDGLIGKNNPEAMIGKGLYLLSTEDHKKEGEDWLEKAAMLGGAEYRESLGLMYLEGDNLPKDNDKAVLWLTRAASAGSLDAMESLGNFYYSNYGEAPDYNKALQWYLEPAQHGSAFAQNRIGYIYGKGLGAKQDYKKALSWYMKAAEQGDPVSQYNVGIYYESGLGVKKDIPSAVTWYTKSAEQGYASAQVSLGDCYQNGTGVPKDDFKAFEWYYKAATQNDAQGQSRLSEMYREGKGTLQDSEKAFYWCKLAAENDYVFAQSNLSLYYYKGEGVEKDLVQSAYWCKKAAEAGRAFSQNNLGSFYYDGIGGLPKDWEKAFYWHKKAAEQMEPTGLYNLALYYYAGEYVQTDNKIALDLFIKSAELGVDDAAYKAGLLYENGQGTRKNMRKARYWMEKAAENGHEGAKKWLSSH